MEHPVERPHSVTHHFKVEDLLREPRRRLAMTLDQARRQLYEAQHRVRDLERDLEALDAKIRAPYSGSASTR